ncbi:MAG: DeoR/GlpR family DNA-binding transcription regulator [Gordonia sp. (in: high G+C Gram-positive bacteria)]
MLLAQRHALLLETLASGGRSVAELAQALNVSESTVRRDLDILAKAGELERSYGGAMLTRGSRATTTDAGTPEAPMSPHRDDLPIRMAIATEAAGLVSDGEVVVLDIGSTTPLVARLLRGRPVTIITSNLAVLDEVRDDSEVELVLLGGVLRRNYQSLVGPLAEQIISQLSADVMFLSCTGVRSGRVVDNMAVEVPIKQALVAASQRIVLLASEHKFPGTGAMRLCDLDDIDVLITSAGTPAEELSAARESGRKVVVV